LFDDARTAPNADGVLVIDEHGDRKWGKKTAHVGRQWLGNMGKTENGVVSVSSLWAEEGVYYPLQVEPYTPAHHFQKGKSDPGFRTKLKIAQELVQRSVAEGVPFRAVAADSFYGEDEDFKQALSSLGVGYVLALKESHSWWHKEGTIGALWEAASAAGWNNAEDPGQWRRVVRTFRDGHQETWWALEVEAGPYSPRKACRALVVTSDPERLPRLGTWYLTTNLPAPGFEEGEGRLPLAPASIGEVVRLYGLRMWVEQSYKQVKHALGWSDYQVRSDPAIRRHWQLVFCAFSFCWWACAEREEELGAPPGIVVLEEDAQVVPAASATAEGRGKKERAASSCSSADMAASAERSKGVAGALHNAVAILEGIHRQGPTRRVESVT
jgi:hypothetical protein